MSLRPALEHVRSAVRTRTRRRIAAGLAVSFTAAALAASGTAATSATWDRLAQCESGQRWNINTGNGYYGGLQFSDGTWDAYGGEEFAGKAHNATREQQITVAERLLADRGWSPWPSCSRKLGLTSADALGNPFAPPVSVPPVATPPGAPATPPTADAAAAALAKAQKKAANKAEALADAVQDAAKAQKEYDKAKAEAKAAANPGSKSKQAKAEKKLANKADALAEAKKDLAKAQKEHAKAATELAAARAAAP